MLHNGAQTGSLTLSTASMPIELLRMRIVKNERLANSIRVSLATRLLTESFRTMYVR